jgi:ABC-2 type transport system permease protein
MSTIRAFVLRDFRVAWSYRFSFFVQNASMLFSLVSLKFVSDLFGRSGSSVLSDYGGDYFAFALLGLGVSLLSYPAVKAFTGGVRAAQVTGTFEAMLTTRAHPALIVLGAGIYPILIVLCQFVLLVGAGGLVFGADYQFANLGLVLVVLVMTIVALAGIGLMSASFTIAFKQSEPFSGALLALSLMISGILYPTSVLPSWLRVFAPMLPVTHAIELTRGLFISGAHVDALVAHFLALAAFCLLLPAGMVTLSLAIGWAKRTGSLAHY